MSLRLKILLPVVAVFAVVATLLVVSGFGTSFGFWIMCAGFAALALVQHWLFGRIVTQPLKALTSEADSFAGRDTSTDADVAGDEIARAGHSVHRLRRLLRDHQSEQRQSAYAIRNLAYSDPITGLPNKPFVIQRLEKALGRAAGSGRQVGVMFVDIDEFRSVNNFVGHSVGDQFLREVAQRLVVALLGRDALVCDTRTMRDHLIDGPIVVARYGIDTFIVLVDSDPNMTALEEMALSVQQAMVPLFRSDGRTLSLTASIGISCSPRHGDDVNLLLQHADTAMHAAKSRSRGDFMVFSDTLDARTFRRLSLESSLAEATRKAEFELHYQPKVDLKSGAIEGVEALARWEHPAHGPVPPAEFIPMSEHTGTIVELGAWVIQSACAQALKWQQAGMPSFRVSVNLSPRQLAAPDLVETVQQALESTGLEPQRLELELTEGALIRDPDRAAEVLDRLKGLGVRIAVDDFGTGYSSLSYLHRFPIDAVKIDQSFVNALTTDQSSQTIVSAIVSMARSLGLTVIAEGVETPEQLAFLHRTDCDQVQGFLFSTPLPPGVFETSFEDTMEFSQDRLREIQQLH